MKFRKRILIMIVIARFTDEERPYKSSQVLIYFLFYGIIDRRDCSVFSQPYHVHTMNVQCLIFIALSLAYQETTPLNIFKKIKCIPVT